MKREFMNSKMRRNQSALGEERRQLWGSDEAMDVHLGPSREVRWGRAPGITLGILVYTWVFSRVNHGEETQSVPPASSSKDKNGEEQSVHSRLGDREEP
jgi:hypothetical protein